MALTSRSAREPIATGTLMKLLSARINLVIFRRLANSTGNLSSLFLGMLRISRLEHQQMLSGMNFSWFDPQYISFSSNSSAMSCGRAVSWLFSRPRMVKCFSWQISPGNDSSWLLLRPSTRSSLRRWMSGWRAVSWLPDMASSLSSSSQNTCTEQWVKCAHWQINNPSHRIKDTALLIILQGQFF